jgi:hypothetical protein
MTHPATEAPGRPTQALIRLTLLGYSIPLVIAHAGWPPPPSAYLAISIVLLQANRIAWRNERCPIRRRRLLPLMTAVVLLHLASEISYLMLGRD